MGSHKKKKKDDADHWRLWAGGWAIILPPNMQPPASPDGVNPKWTLAFFIMIMMMMTMVSDFSKRVQINQCFLKLLLIFCVYLILGSISSAKSGTSCPDNPRGLRKIGVMASQCPDNPRLLMKDRCHPRPAFLHISDILDQPSCTSWELLASRAQGAITSGRLFQWPEFCTA